MHFHGNRTEDSALQNNARSLKRSGVVLCLPGFLGAPGNRQGTATQRTGVSFFYTSPDPEPTRKTQPPV